ncbi:hypothetical protein [Streptomyces specialis]|uniref:hypothetical protein n=1 Tax=Streptomyces specialis TaxID=498367 RepID=UPI00073F5FBA|nr:hypothetical protein [Streptomyces specialis]
MTSSLALFLFAVQAAVLFALLIGAVAGLLAAVGGATVPQAIARGGAAFGVALTVLAALLGIAVQVTGTQADVADRDERGGEHHGRLELG